MIFKLKLVLYIKHISNLNSRRCKRHLCSLNTGGRLDDLTPLWSDRLWKRDGEKSDFVINRTTGPKGCADACGRLTHMVKCWGICFSLGCALCSPPQRSRGGSNMAATIKEGKPIPVRGKQSRGYTALEHNVLLLPPALIRRVRGRDAGSGAVSLKAHVELFSEELAIVGRAYPVLLLQRVQRDGEVPLGWRGRSGEEDHCLLACVGRENTAVRLLTVPSREHYKLLKHLQKQA